MDVHDEFIPEDTFREFVAQMPQVCVETVVERVPPRATERASGERSDPRAHGDGAVLLARRTNEPVRGEWFWPGSRLYKGEHLADAARRVGREELGLDLAIDDQLGVYEHLWETSAPGPSRHTVNVVFRARASDIDGTLSEADVTLDDQHDAVRFVQPADVDESYHEYVQRYAADLVAIRGQ
jgi:colanic acid biosynthesis protein WcaH